MRCPGLDRRFWKEDAIFYVNCPCCSARIEFFKDDPKRKCESCGETFVNPQLETNCTEYCKYGDRCKEWMRFN